MLAEGTEPEEPKFAECCTKIQRAGQEYIVRKGAIFEKGHTNQWIRKANDAKSQMVVVKRDYKLEYGSQMCLSDSHGDEGAWNGAANAQKQPLLDDAEGRSKKLDHVVRAADHSRPLQPSTTTTIGAATDNTATTVGIDPERNIKEQVLHVIEGFGHPNVSMKRKVLRLLKISPYFNMPVIAQYVQQYPASISDVLLEAQQLVSLTDCQFECLVFAAIIVSGKNASFLARMVGCNQDKLQVLNRLPLSLTRCGFEPQAAQWLVKHISDV